MAQNWIQAVILLLFCQTISSASGKVIGDGERVEISCKPPITGSTVFWFRVVDNAHMEFIVAFTGKLMKTEMDLKIFEASQSSETVLILKSFNKVLDSGTYGCATINRNQLMFGTVTRLAGPDPPKTTATSVPLTTNSNPTTTKSCACNTEKVEKRNPALSCDPLIWGPLAGACGLLTHLLIVTICYCNRIRTRRCPHHYKRRPGVVQGKTQAMVPRYV